MSAPDSVHDLAKARLAARAEKNFALSDQLRDEIAAQGFEVVDAAGGYEALRSAFLPTNQHVIFAPLTRVNLKSSFQSKLVIS